MNNKIILGARGSKLSMAYANKVKNMILDQNIISGKNIEIQTIQTSGDLFQNKKKWVNLIIKFKLK